MKQYVFDRFSEEARRLINQTGVKARMIEKEGNEKFNACWDALVGPDGAFYYPLSSEEGFCSNTKLAKYDFATNSVRVCIDTEKILLPSERMLPHSKFHTAMNVIPRSAFYPECEYDPDDYLIIANTHSTDGAKHHPECMLFAHYDDALEGFPGSHLIIYDPKNDHSFSLGIPVPRETIYGAKYEPKHNRLYMIGFMRGHIYCYDLNERRVIKDMGKVAEVFSYRLALGADGHIYGCSKSGQLFKINTDTVEVEHLDFHVPDFPDNFVSYTWYRNMVVAHNSPDGKYLYMAIASLDTMYKLEFATGKVTPMGSCLPLDGLYELPAKDSSWMIRAFDIDKDGVLWLCVAHWSLHNDTEYFFPRAMYLIRWDVDRGEEPFCCGLIGTEELYQECVTEIEIDKKRDILYFVNTATDRPKGVSRPMAGGIDLAKFRPHYKERGPVCHDPILTIYKMTPEEIAERKRKLDLHGGEENAVGNPFAAFDPLKMTPVRIWRSLPRLEVGESKVIGMAFDPERSGKDYLLHVVCGEAGTFAGASYVLQVAGGKVVSIQKMSEIAEDYKAWLQENILPRPLQFDDSVKLPEQTGRRYLSKASCAISWQDGKPFVGTNDAMAAIVSPNGKVFALGKAAPTGPIRAMVANKAKTHLWGVAGDRDDMGYVFQFDQEDGLNQLGIINYNTYGYYDGPVAANLLSSITLSPDEKYLAVGSADRIAMVAIVEL